MLESCNPTLNLYTYLMSTFIPTLSFTAKWNSINLRNIKAEQECSLSYVEIKGDAGIGCPISSTKYIYKGYVLFLL